MTTQQQRVLDAITKHWRLHGCGPSIRDLCSMMGIASPNGIACHLKALERAGQIETDGRMSRAIWPAGLRKLIKDAAK